MLRVTSDLASLDINQRLSLAHHDGARVAGLFFVRIVPGTQSDVVHVQPLQLVDQLFLQQRVGDLQQELEVGVWEVDPLMIVGQVFVPITDARVAEVEDHGGTGTVCAYSNLLDLNVEQVVTKGEVFRSAERREMCIGRGQFWGQPMQLGGKIRRSMGMKPAWILTLNLQAPP